MEKSQWQIAAESSKFDDTTSNRVWATVSDPAHISAHSARAQHKSAKDSAKHSAAAGAFELDWAGNVVKRASVRSVPHPAAMADHWDGHHTEPSMPTQKKHYESNINLSSCGQADPTRIAQSAAYQTGPGVPGADDWRTYVYKMLTL